MKSESALLAWPGKSAMPIEAAMWNSAPATANGRAERLHDPLAGELRDDLRVLGAAVEQQQELVAALAREHVAGARQRRDPLGGLAQDRVAAGVAERVVDRA